MPTLLVQSALFPWLCLWYTIILYLSCFSSNNTLAIIAIEMSDFVSAGFPHSLFAIAHTDIQQRPFNNSSRSLRHTIEANVSAYGFRILLSNLYGTSPLPVGEANIALCSEEGVLQIGTAVPVTVNGVGNFELAPGEEVESDFIDFKIEAGQFFAISIYYPTSERVNSGNWIGNTAKRSRPGNYTANLEMPGPSIVSRFARTVIITDVTVATTTVSQIWANCPEQNNLVACFGDSITQQSNWTAPFTKLLYHTYPGQITVCNLGISGNRLLCDSPPALGGLNGIAGIRRFEHDVLQLKGLTHTIIAIGTNDIGLPASHGAPEEELISLGEYAQAMETLAKTLRDRSVKVYAVTLAPRALNGPYDEARERLRKEINHWIRQAACFDAVLDFDTVLARPDGTPGMKEGYTLPDGLHPSPYGGLWLAKSIDLSLFAPVQNAKEAPLHE